MLLQLYAIKHTSDTLCPEKVSVAVFFSTDFSPQTSVIPCVKPHNFKIIIKLKFAWSGSCMLMAGVTIFQLYSQI